DNELIEELAELFEELGAALTARDGPRAAALFDVPRMVEEMGLSSVLPAWSPARAEFAEGVGNDLVNYASTGSLEPAWDRSEVRRVGALPAAELVGTARHRLKDRSILKMRWWLTAASGSWKVYDREDLDVGIRVSVTMALPTKMTYRRGVVDPAGQARGDR